MRFSKIEIKELAKAWIFISLAFTILFSGGLAGLSLSSSFLIFFLLSGLTVGLAFLFHELMHKSVAQKYGFRAEFRAFDKMLWLSLIMSFFGFIIAAPGAVVIEGRMDKDKNGKISLAGPLSNLILALIFMPFFFMNLSGLLETFVMLGFRINSLLALFNILPIQGFDGKKVLAWNKIAYFLVFILAAILFSSSFLF